MVLILQGKWARLRTLTYNDAGITLYWRSSPRARFLQAGAVTVNEQSAWIRASERAGDLNFIIEYEGYPVGMIALVDINRTHKTIQMGRLLIGEKARVGTAPVAFEADLMLSDYAFDTLGMQKIYGDIMVDNKAMIAMRLWQGYHQDGILRAHYIYNGVRKDTVAISMLVDEYHSFGRQRLLDAMRLMGG